MIDQNSTAEEIDAYKAEVTSAAETLDAKTRENILARAAAEGWSASQARWLDIIAKQPLFQAVVDGTPVVEALEQAYGEARRTLTVGYFNNALDEGKDRYTAFLTVIDLEKQLAERRGEAPPSYPQVVLLEACRAAEAAAQRGLASEEQIVAGFAVIQELSKQARS
jgi:hypothetical protein